MQLTRYSDYALRVLICLALKPKQLGNTAEIAKTLHVPQNHLAKIVSHLVKLDYISSMRGPTGGIKLAREPSTINLGQLVRHTEQNLQAINCITPACVFSPACQLKPIFNEATAAFLSTLDKYTLSDITANKRQLNKLLA